MLCPWSQCISLDAIRLLFVSYSTETHYFFVEIVKKINPHTRYNVLSESDKLPTTTTVAYQDFVWYSMLQHTETNADEKQNTPPSPPRRIYPPSPRAKSSLAPRPRYRSSEAKDTAHRRTSSVWVLSCGKLSCAARWKTHFVGSRQTRVEANLAME